MIIDCHVHVSACSDGHGRMSPHLLNCLSMRFVRWRFGLVGSDEATERAFEARLVETITGTAEIDAAVVLAFDAVHTPDGELDARGTHLYVTNDYVIELAQRHPRVLFGASIHPYRKDALAELERCIQAGALLVKWLPLTQGIDPADPRCFPFYEALAHHGIPLLSHTGWEQALPIINSEVADPMLLLPALQRGVTVIAAHCGTRALPWQRDYLPQFLRLARDHEHFYGDTAALCLPTRAYAFDAILADDTIRAKLIHGSDWPIVPIPPFSRIGWSQGIDLLAERNWMRRDVLIKQRLGFDDAYWHRAASILRLSRPQSVALTA